MPLKTITIFALFLFAASSSIASAQNLKQPTLGGSNIQSKIDTGEITQGVKITSDATILAENDPRVQTFRTYINTLNVAGLEELPREITLYALRFENVGKVPLKILATQDFISKTSLAPLYQTLQGFSFTLAPSELLWVRFLASGKPVTENVLVYTAAYEVDPAEKDGFKTETSQKWQFYSGAGIPLWLPNFFSIALPFDKDLIHR